MTPWEDAWFNGKLMPPHGLPKLMLIRAEAIAEEWLLEAAFRCMFEEWVSRERAADAVIEVLWTGCRVRSVLTKRVPPVPVIVRLMHAEPYPSNIVELEDRMLEVRAIAAREWIEAYRKHGDNLEAAP
jgi:hypothetical protein